MTARWRISRAIVLCASNPICVGGTDNETGWSGLGRGDVTRRGTLYNARGIDGMHDKRLGPHTHRGLPRPSWGTSRAFTGFSLNRVISSSTFAFLITPCRSSTFSWASSWNVWARPSFPASRRPSSALWNVAAGPPGRRRPDADAGTDDEGDSGQAAGPPRAGGRGTPRTGDEGYWRLSRDPVR